MSPFCQLRDFDDEREEKVAEAYRIHAAMETGAFPLWRRCRGFKKIYKLVHRLGLDLLFLFSGIRIQQAILGGEQKKLGNEI